MRLRPPNGVYSLPAHRRVAEGHVFVVPHDRKHVAALRALYWSLRRVGLDVSTARGAAFDMLMLSVVAR